MPRALAWLLLLALAAPSASAGGDPGRNNVSSERGLPAAIDLATGKGVRWSVELGSEAYGGPTAAGGKVFVGTNNARPRDAKVTGDRGIVMAFAASDGAFLWQAVHDKLAAGKSQDWPNQGVCSTPAVVGDRLYYLSNRGELVAADVEGFRDGENDGPFQGEATSGPAAADFVWKLDLVGRFGVVPHFMVASSPLVVGDRIYVMTGNGIDEQGKVPAPKAPSFVAVDRKTGEVLWQDASPGAGLLEGQWASPAHGQAGGKAQVVFAAGDGSLYGLEAASGKRLWKLDANRPSKPEAPRGQEAFVGSPLFVDGRVYAAVGRNPELGSTDGLLLALDAAKTGELGPEAALWRVGGRDFSRSLSTPVLADGILYAADLAGFLHAFDAASGKLLWKYDAFAAVWGSPLVADGKVYLGDEDGDLAILTAGREFKVLAEVNLGDAIYTTPAAADGTLFVVTGSKLFAFGGPKG